MSYKPIGDYGVIGDMHSAALVGLDGSIDWLCLPDFDSPSVFAAILDDKIGGSWHIRPQGRWTVEQNYLEGTNVLSTRFSTDLGEVEVTDLMPVRNRGMTSDHRLLRIVRGVAGSIRMESGFQPRLDYGRGRTRYRKVEGGVIAEQGHSRLALTCPVGLSVDEHGASGEFEVSSGETLVFAIEWAAASPPPTGDWHVELDGTLAAWRDIANSVGYEGRWQDQVIRSVLALNLLVYMPTGALVAAVTTSLPESIGGQRNWDYRYCWIRDTAFVLDALDRLGQLAETRRFLEWLTTICPSSVIELQTLYGVRYEEELAEETLDHLAGYRGSRPVRIGNGASGQLQLDIFGEALIACATYHRAGGQITDEMWSTIESLVRGVVDNWRREDRGIWEVRGRKRHFVHSKVMCWLALERAIVLAETLKTDIDLSHWRRVRDEIHSDVMEHGWSEDLQSFVQYYGAGHTDAALLMIPFVGFLPADHPRVSSTVQRIREELEENGLLRRYPTEKTDDGLEGNEGIFTMCSLWLAGYLTFVGELEEAEALFERVLAYGNHLGLFSEMVDAVSGEALGNFPQAFTHVSLIHTARNLDLALSQRHPPTVHHMQFGRTGPRPDGEARRRAERDSS